MWITLSYFWRQEIDIHWWIIVSHADFCEIIGFLFCFRWWQFWSLDIDLKQTLSFQYFKTNRAFSQKPHSLVVSSKLWNIRMTKGMRCDLIRLSNLPSLHNNIFSIFEFENNKILGILKLSILSIYGNEFHSFLR